MENLNLLNVNLTPYDCTFSIKCPAGGFHHSTVKCFNLENDAYEFLAKHIEEPAAGRSLIDVYISLTLVFKDTELKCYNPLEFLKNINLVRDIQINFHLNKMTFDNIVIKVTDEELFTVIGDKSSKFNFFYKLVKLVRRYENLSQPELLFPILQGRGS